MIDRYVKLDDVMDAIGGVPKKKDSPYPTPIHLAAERIINKIKERIAKVPTADVMEVKHGKWIVPSGGIKIFEDRYVICSECNVMIPVVKELDRYWYCPKCGAKMDGGNAE